MLGAAAAPTDATAVGALARSVPRRILTVLRAESLVNDGTAVVIFSLAVGITAGAEHFSALYTGWLFLRAYGCGAVTAWLAVRVRRHLDDPLLENVAILLIPFSAFLLAEAIHASGVLAVVVCGLIMSQAGPRVGNPGARQPISPRPETTVSWGGAVKAAALPGRTRVRPGHRPLAHPPAHHRQPRQDRRHRAGSACPHPFRIRLHQMKIAR